MELFLTLSPVKSIFLNDMRVPSSAVSIPDCRHSSNTKSWKRLAEDVKHRKFYKGLNSVQHLTLSEAKELGELPGRVGEHLAAVGVGHDCHGTPTKMGKTF